MEGGSHAVLGILRRINHPRLGRAWAGGDLVRDSASATSTALLRWIVYWLVLPHLLIILMWPTGGPPMGLLLTLSGLSALLISFIPVKPLQRLLLLCLMIVGTACYV